jgi:hypothetical protein
MVSEAAVAIGLPLGAISTLAPRASLDLDVAPLWVLDKIGLLVTRGEFVSCRPALFRQVGGISFEGALTPGSCASKGSFFSRGHFRRDALPR